MSVVIFAFIVCNEHVSSPSVWHKHDMTQLLQLQNNLTKNTGNKHETEAS